MHASVGSTVSGTLRHDSAASCGKKKKEKKAFLFHKDGAAHEILIAARSVFIPLTAPEYQLLALRQAPEGPISPSPDLQIRLAAEINRSTTKCAVTNAESGGRKQI